MADGKFISYLRVSTDKQGKSGLGIEAQREAVVRYLNGGQWTLSAEYVETETGKRADRPKLAAALAHAKAIGAKLVFAKLDRLTRNVDLLRSLVASSVDLVFCDLPSVPPGPMGRFLLTQMAAVAELEAGLIGERTKNALAAAKARCEARQSQWRTCPQRQTGGQRGCRSQNQSKGGSEGRGPTRYRGRHQEQRNYQRARHCGRIARAGH
jgi:DNA invertase Pin-like site-specific DNA recombinase